MNMEKVEMFGIALECIARDSESVALHVEYKHMKNMTKLFYPL